MKDTRTLVHHAKRHKWLVAAASLVVITGWLNSPRVPIYDGLAFPDEPYRYVSSSTEQNKSTLLPTTASGSLNLRGGTNPDSLNIASLEQGPQANVLLANHTVWADNKATSATVTITPLAPSGSIPPNGVIVGNMYNYSLLSTPKGPITFRVNHRARSAIDLRLPQGNPTGAVVDYRPTGASDWQALSTIRSGNDIYDAPLVGLGDYALVPQPVKATTSDTVATSGRGGLLTAILGVVVLVIAGLILIIRLKTAKRRKVAS